MAINKLLCICLSLSILLVSAKKELKLLQVLAVNKFYVPDYDYSSTEFKVPKNLTYEYFIKNAVDVPNSVKLDLFNLGEDLRNSYDNFLGSIYEDEIIQMQTTEFPVSIIAGELINAGMWPPVEPQIWNKDLAWQPIPFEYKSAEEDTLLLGTLCPNFKLETKKVLHNNLSSFHLELLKYLNLTGQIKISNLLEIPHLYFALENSMILNQTLPEWTKKIFPGKDLLNATLTAYDLLSKTNIQKRLNGGTFIKTIIKNSNDYINGSISNQRKINIYSGDDRIFAGVIRNLNIPLYDVPAVGSALIFELYAENNDYFIKFVYKTGAKNESLPIMLIGCDLFCPIKKFTKLMDGILPGDEDTLCFSSMDTKYSGGASINFPMSNLLLSILLMIPLFFKF